MAVLVATRRRPPLSGRHDRPTFTSSTTGARSGRYAADTGAGCPDQSAQPPGLADRLLARGAEAAQAGDDVLEVMLDLVQGVSAEPGQVELGGLGPVVDKRP